VHAEPYHITDLHAPKYHGKKEVGHLRSCIFVWFKITFPPKTCRCLWVEQVLSWQICKLS